MSGRKLVFILIVLVRLLCASDNAFADLGHVVVLSGSPQIGSTLFKELRERLYDAFDDSESNDGNYVYILDLLPEIGVDRFHLERANYNGLTGWKVTGGSESALRTGVREIETSLRNSSHQLSEGRHRVTLENFPVTLPVTARLSIDPSKFTSEGTLPTAVHIRNGMQTEITFQTFGIEPSPWNGESVSIGLVNIRREGEQLLLFEANPEIDRPDYVAGFSAVRIEPDDSLTIRTDAAKWKIRGGWKPGTYTVDAIVKNLSIDDGRCLLSVMTEPVTFVIE